MVFRDNKVALVGQRTGTDGFVGNKQMEPDTKV
jgi:hypothetical protein